MAEVQKGQTMGELSQRFIEFVMMHAQNAALFLGQIPNPRTGEGEVNLDLAKMFIDQLDMIQEKTRGNLTSEETTVLRNALSNLQMTYVEVAKGHPQPSERTAPPASAEATAGRPPEAQQSPQAKETPPAGSTTTEPSKPAVPSEPEDESKKKFTKSYGP